MTGGSADRAKRRRPSRECADRYPPIGQHGVVGDLDTVALIALDGSVDFMCFPEFGSETIFAALLDADRGGRFVLSSEFPEATRRQLYLPDSNVLLTRFLSDRGVAEVTDFMPVGDGPGNRPHRLLRRARSVRGRVRFTMRCEPRFDYARAEMEAEQVDDHTVVFRARDGRSDLELRLAAGVGLSLDGAAAVAEFELDHEQNVDFVLEPAASPGPHPALEPDHLELLLDETLAFWHRWIGRCHYRGRWRESVRRAALTLKLLFSERHGGLVAAPTFGLPETLGGTANWDYRFTWLRDSAHALYALMRLGYLHETRQFMGWLERRTEESDAAADVAREAGPLQVLYSVDAKGPRDERALDHLEGWCGTQPVLIGNQAHAQLQLDVYGEILDAAWCFELCGHFVGYETWRHFTKFVDWLCANWHRKDHGIWEIRGEPHEYLHSRVMCWVAFDRAIRLAERRSLPGPLPRWRRVRNQVYRDIHERFFDPDLGAFVQRPGTRTLDAACLLMPIVGFIGPDDPRWLTTLDVVEERLVEDSLVHRYRSEAQFEADEFPEENTFDVCTFWYVQCLARAGRLDQARLVLEKMLGYANHLGLYAEELNLRGDHLGNFPLAFTHLGLITAAMDLDRLLTEAGEAD